MGDNGMINGERTTETLAQLYKFIQEESIWNSHGDCRKSTFFKPFKITKFEEKPISENFPALFESLLKEQEAKIQAECDEYNKKQAIKKEEEELNQLAELKKKYEGT